ncbi:MAG: V0D/AC39 family V-type ATPase subunit [Roseburia intestinalis]
MWMYRAKRFYSMGEADVKKHQIPVSCRLRSAETKRLLETETAEQFVEFVRQTAYFRGKQAVLEPEDELTWERVMIRTYEKICKKHPMSVAPVLRYLYEKEHEIDLLATALEGIRYRIPPYEIRDLIFAM